METVYHKMNNWSIYFVNNVLVISEGYHYLGGETQGHKGPYIWKETKKQTFDVQLPNQKTQYTVNLLSGFISRS